MIELITIKQRTRSIKRHFYMLRHAIVILCITGFISPAGAQSFADKIVQPSESKIDTANKKQLITFSDTLPYVSKGKRIVPGAERLHGLTGINSR